MGHRSLDDIIADMRRLPDRTAAHPPAVHCAIAGALAIEALRRGAWWSVPDVRARLMRLAGESPGPIRREVIYHAAVTVCGAGHAPERERIRRIADWLTTEAEALRPMRRSA